VPEPASLLHELCQEEHSTDSLTAMLNQMWRALAAFRVVALGYAAVLIVRDHGQYAHPAAGVLVLAGMAGWTLATVVAYAHRAGRARWLLVADVAVAAALVIATRWIDAPARIDAGSATLPAFWAAAPVLACAVAGGPWAGVAAALAIAGADMIEHQQLQPENTFNGVVLLLIAGGIVGYVVRLGARAEDAARSATRREAAAAERERLARSIHDSVLQVLALVTSRGRALGGEAAELGNLAAQQEAALRALMSGSPEDGHEAGVLDVRSVTEPLADARVTVSGPATAVLLPEQATRALGAAAVAAVDNVRRHAGADARCWVLLEDDAAAVLLTVRDDGCGFADGRLTEAAAAGRLGVAQSIVGRLESIGGTASVISAPGAGTEVELRVPRA
jgi:signal transduction histidine kinase